MLQLRRLLYYLFFFWFFVDQGISESYPFEKYAYEINLKDYHRNILRADRPIHGLSFDSSRTKLWLLGQQYLWRWDFQRQSLKKIRLKKETLANSDTDDKIFQLDHTQAIAVTSGSKIFIIRDDPFEVIEFEQAAKGLVKTFFIKDRYPDILWSRSDGVYAIDLRQNQISVLSEYSLSEPERDGGAESPGYLWTFDSNRVFKKNLRDHSEFVVYQSSDPINRVVAGHQSDLLIFTDSALLRFDLKGKLIQIIPIRTTEPLIAYSLSAQVHAFLFGQGLLEIYNFVEQSKETWYLSHASDQRKFSQGILFDSLLAAISDEVPSVFLLRTP